jgi:carboxypeptidase C (cathepsin A)
VRKPFLAGLCLAIALSLSLLSPSLAADGPPKIPPFDLDSHESKGAVTIGGKHIDYTAIAGAIQIEDSKDEAAAAMSYVAYFAKNTGNAKRPVTFIYNGGPGSATVWLHMGAFGPKRVVTGDGERGPAAPYNVIDNAYSPMDVSDLVFIDAPSTGFGRVGADERSAANDAEREKIVKKREELKKEFFGVDADARAFEIFITKFLSKYDRWNVPKFLFGESYGTTRSAALIYRLQENARIDFNGVMLLSQILNFSTSADREDGNPGVDLGYQLALPTFAASAWYHKKLANPPKDLEPFLAEVEAFTLGDYATALAAGDSIDPKRKQAIAEKISAYTGLDATYILRANLRINGGMFEKMLLDSKGLTVGRLDTRFTGPSLDVLSKEADYDPQAAAIASAYISAYNDYARGTLGMPKDAKYVSTAALYRDWDFRHRPPGSRGAFAGATNVMPDLAAAMKVNPNLKVMLASGVYDLATLYFAAEFELNHLGLPPELRKNIEIHRFKAGHMVYVNPDLLHELHDQMAKFITSNVPSGK